MTYLEGPPRPGPTPSALLAATAVLTLIFLAIANYNGGGNGGTGPFLIYMIITLAVAAGLLYCEPGQASGRPTVWDAFKGEVRHRPYRDYTLGVGGR